METKELEQELKDIASYILGAFSDSVYKMLESYETDKIAFRCVFQDITDSMCKSDEISQDTYMNIDIELSEYKDFIITCSGLEYNINLKSFV